MKTRKKKNKIKHVFRIKKNILKQHILNNNDKLNIPILNEKQDINVNSWFDITEYNQEQPLFDTNINLEYDVVDDDDEDDEFGKYYTKRINLLPTDIQKQILFKWLDGYTYMYNRIVKYIKECRFNKEKVVFNITKLKKMFLEDKQQIMEKTKININNKIKTIDSHPLDYALQDSINIYRSCLTNLKRGNIKYFRLRYLKMNKPRRIFKIEKLAVKENGFHLNTFGEMKTDIDDFNFLENMHTVATIQYSQNKFYLLLKYPTDMKKKKEIKDNVVAIDPGVRKFGVGYGNNKIIVLCQKSKKKIISILKKIDNINNSSMINYKKNKYTKKKYAYIYNMIDDMHWKTINYLTNNYKTIMIGNLSTKNIVEKELAPMTKRIANIYSLFQFKQKLKYKCKYLNISYKEVDEAYTSKTCSRCAKINDTLNGSEMFECKNCKLFIDRDINGAINIFQRNIIN